MAASRVFFAASFLVELETTLGEPLVEHFDLISGTSTDGIIALGLGMGLSTAIHGEETWHPSAQVPTVSRFYEFDHAVHVKYAQNAFLPDELAFAKALDAIGERVWMRDATSACKDIQRFGGWICLY